MGLPYYEAWRKIQLLYSPLAFLFAIIRNIDLRKGVYKLSLVQRASEPF